MKKLSKVATVTLSPPLPPKISNFSETTLRLLTLNLSDRKMQPPSK